MNTTATKYNTAGAAHAAAGRTVKPHAVIIGDDGLFWLVTLAAAERLAAAGYERAN